LKLNGTQHFLVYADGVNILGGKVHTLREEELLIVNYKEMLINSVYGLVSRSECRTNSHCEL